MSKILKIQAIIRFIAQHPQSTVSRRICRELLGAGMEQLQQEFAAELQVNLENIEDKTIDSYYYLVR